MPDHPAPGAPAEHEAERPTLRGRTAVLLRELRNHPFGYGVMAAFTLAGPACAIYLFPDAPIGVTLIGGFALGAYAAMCAVPQKFL